MKKVIVVLALVLMAASAQAATVITAANAPKGFNPTKNVTVTYDVLVVGTVNTAYGVISQHSQGDKVFASTSSYGGIVSMTTTPGSMLGAPPTVPATPTDSSIDATWTRM